jgi:hypothetical protein
MAVGQFASEILPCGFCLFAIRASSRFDGEDGVNKYFVARVFGD